MITEHMHHTPHVHHVPWFMSAPANTALKVVLFGAGVALLGSVLFDFHAHTCDRCGSRWHHLGAFNGGNTRAHTCTSCGAEQWWKDHAR